MTTTRPDAKSRLARIERLIRPVMTARELARRLGVHESLVSLWLDDKRNISPEMLDKAEQELGLTPVNALDIRTVPGPLKPE